ncbi:uncharacterized protein LOC118743928 [Rhagoletis pomonella]|uniref:uncharacterized protein LOC118743928 n=1 Tax=Rhagoletis pomonella TaxID=28610 RepID=UPI0017829D12|nr:uncharacterized protein LOC118743928 [Rhagoletis pomonella]
MSYSQTWSPSFLKTECQSVYAKRTTDPKGYELYENEANEFRKFIVALEMLEVKQSGRELCAGGTVSICDIFQLYELTFKPWIFGKDMTDTVYTTKPLRNTQTIYKILHCKIFVAFSVLFLLIPYLAIPNTYLHTLSSVKHLINFKQRKELYKQSNLCDCYMKNNKESFLNCLAEKTKAVGGYYTKILNGLDQSF